MKFVSFIVVFISLSQLTSGSEPTRFEVSVAQHRAMTVALQDFTQRLTTGNQTSKDERGRFLSNISNYVIAIEDASEGFKVWIHPKPSAEFPYIFGSDATYIIEDETYEILSRRLGE